VNYLTEASQLTSTAKHCLLVYGTRSRILRRIVYPDYDSQLMHHVLLDGESSLIVPMDNFGCFDIEDIKAHSAYAAAHLETLIGKPLHSGRCALVPKDTEEHVIEHVINADPWIDSLPAHNLILHDTVSPGWVYRKGALTET
jgi:hypothetical protein